jgi:NodT family efflux transporter outer membrane factor (OMF) lipoprotein
MRERASTHSARALARWSLVLAAGAMLTACAIGPRYEAPVLRLPAEYSALDSASVANAPAGRDRAAAPTPSPASPAGDSSAVAARRGIASSSLSAEPLQSPFWNELGDSTLVQLIHEGLRSNPDVKALEARLREARASRQRAMFDLAPTITASGGFAQQRLSAAQLPGVPSSLREESLWDVGFDASWELDVFGRVRRNVSAQGSFESSALEDVRFVRISLAAELARTYFELRGAQGELAVAQRNGENQRRTLAITEQRLAAGRGTAFDTERARAQLNTTLAAVPLLESQVARDQYRIATLLGRPSDSLPPALLQAADLPPLPAQVHVGSPTLLVQRRPDVVSAERQLEAQTALVGAAQADYLPRLTVGGSVGRTSTDINALNRGLAVRFLVGPTISWPFLDLGRVRAGVDESRARAEAARASYSATVLRALEEAETSLVAYDRARARLDRLADAASASERAASLARMRFEGGVSDFLQVLDAERTMLDAENQLARGRTDAATALVAVYKAVGGTWRSESEGGH